MVGSNFVNWYMVLKSKIEHIKGRVPSSQDITWHYTDLEAKVLEFFQPLRKDDC